MLSICTTVKNRSLVATDSGVLRLFPKCVESIVAAHTAIDDLELVVADWESDDWPLDQWLPDAVTTLALQLVQMEGGFSRGRGLNAAARAASGDMLFFTDADCLICPLVIEKSVRYMREGKAFFPVLYSFDGPDHCGGWWRHSGYGNATVTRDTYQHAGGWPEYDKWGKEDDDFYERVSGVASVVREEVPGFFHQWHPEDLLWKDRYAFRDPEEVAEIQQVRVALCELAKLIPAGQPLILVDETRFGVDEIDGRQAYPFLEQHGEYAGPPSDDVTAIQELERLRATGVRYVAFAWITFWWLDHYVEFAAYVRSRFRQVWGNERLIVFDMRPEWESS
jgi:hypothetical protein